MADPDIEAVRAQLAAKPRPKGPAERRARLDAIGGQYELAPDIRVEPVSADGVRAEWTLAPSSDPARVLMFLHGGGYMAGSLASHRHLVAEAGRLSGARTLAVDYRLAPEHPFPAALEDALTAYRFLLKQGVDPRRVALCGESAGGGLAVAALCALRDAGDPSPACAWLSSPWTDLAQSGATMASKAAVDPLISKRYLDELAAAYLQGADPDNPLASPVRAKLAGLPPLLIFVGTAETMLDDSMSFAAAAGAADVRVTLEIWPDMIHAFTLFYPQVAVARRALAEVGDFVRKWTGCA
ncbi:alpha/beta hydrolase [Methylocella sp.]|uniref:alpha/beta hydrolase n=1 Tax=Methylocella sp. TaxID=1978226 RepID=UPI0035AFB1F2